MVRPMMSPPYTEVGFTLPYSLPFDGEYDFDWAGDSFSVKIANKQVFDERSEAVTGLKFAASGGGSVTVFGPHGLSHLAQITVRFRQSFEEAERPGLPLRIPDSDRAREHACLAVNRLIETYREATNDSDIRRVKPQHDVLALNVELVDEGGGGTTGWGFGHKSRLVYPLQVRGFEEAKELMLLLLRDEVPIQIWRDYIHEARRFFKEREFALAVVLANAALELFWAGLLRAGLANQGVADEEARKKLEKWTSPTLKKGTLALLDQGLQEVFSRSMQAELPLLWGILNMARYLRKNVVHPWPKRPEAGETLRAMIAIEFAVDWLTRGAVAAMNRSPEGTRGRSV
jgi:hypothetical protein